MPVGVQRKCTLSCLSTFVQGVGVQLLDIGTMECLHPKYIAKQEMVVPCGRCAFCSATRRTDWATRLHYEGLLHYGSKFVTLTYDDKFLNWEYGNPQLSKYDLQCWFKRVRNAGYKFRYYAVGEYGSRTYRPHYHVLVFGDVPRDILINAWTKVVQEKRVPIGHVHIGNVTQASINYCLGYMVTGKSWQMLHKRVRPFCLMSRRPGLGANYLSSDMKAWHKSDRKNYVMLEGEKKHLPRYYKTKIFSKVDLVRIAVRDQKAVFKKMVEWIRHPHRARMKDPLAYYELMRKRAAQRIKFKTKQTNII